MSSKTEPETKLKTREAEGECSTILFCRSLPGGGGGLLPWSPKLDAGRFWSRAPRIYSTWHAHDDGNEYGMITTNSARWAGVEISFNFLRWRLSFEMVGQNLFRYNNVVECPFLLVCCSVFSKKTQCEELND